MRTLKQQLNLFGIARHGVTTSEPERKRRQLSLEELIKMDRPGSLVVVIGFISPLPSWGL